MAELNGNISMELIAERLGVSAMTVSRALKAKEPPQRKSAAELFHKIRGTAAELGYRKSFAPRSMLTGRYDFIGILGSDRWRRNDMPHTRLVGLQKAASRHGVSLLFNRIADDKLQDPAFIPEIFSNWRSDGLLINYASGYPERLEQLLVHYRSPAIWMNSKHEADCVHPDDFGGARLAAAHLIGLGHKRIALWANTPRVIASRFHYSLIDRSSGYRSIMQETGLEIREMKNEAPLRYRDFQAFVESFLSQPDRPTAILAYGIPQAVAVLRAAANMNLRIPEELSLICFHDEKNIFQVTTVFIPEMRLGIKAIDLIMKKIEKPEERLAPVALPMELYLPDITCAPPERKTR